MKISQKEYQRRYFQKNKRRLYKKRNKWQSLGREDVRKTLKRLEKKMDLILEML